MIILVILALLFCMTGVGLSLCKTKLNKAVLSKATKKSSKSIKLTWKKVSGANGYEIYMKTHLRSFHRSPSSFRLPPYKGAFRDLSFLSLP